MSQKQVAAAIGINYQTYQRFEDPRTFNATVKSPDRQVIEQTGVLSEVVCTA